MSDKPLVRLHLAVVRERPDGKGAELAFVHQGQSFVYELGGPEHLTWIEILARAVRPSVPGNGITAASRRMTGGQ